MLIRPREPDRDLRLAHRQAEFSRIGDQIDHNLRVLHVQDRKTGRENVAGDGLSAGDANEAGETRVATAGIPFQGERLCFETLRLLADILADQCWHIPVRGSIEQPDAEARLQRGEATPYGRLGDAKVLGSSR